MGYQNFDHLALEELIEEPFEPNTAREPDDSLKAGAQVI